MRAGFGCAQIAIAAVAWWFAGSAAGAQTPISFRFNDPEAAQMRQALDVFEQLNPGIKVDM